MANITKDVWKVIDKDASIRRDVSRGIINKRALANYIIKKKNVKAAVNAVISAIRRYQDENPSKEMFEQAIEVIMNSTMTSKNGIVSLTLEKDEETERILPKLYSFIEVGKHQMMRIIQTDESIKVIFDKKNLNRTKKNIPDRKIKRAEKDIAEITIHLDERSWKTPGIVALITSELSMNDINIIEVMSCMPNIIIFFKEKDLMNAYNILYELTNKSIK